MRSIDEDALFCDMAETYHIFDTDSLPVLVYARLAVGLRDDSRIKMKMDGFKRPLNTLLLALLFDKLTNLFRNEDSEPSNLYETFQADPKPSDGNVKIKNGRMVFSSPEEFERAWEEN